MAKSIPSFESTSVETIQPLVNGLRAAFNTQVTKPIEFRLTQLRKLFWGISDNEAALAEALKLDLGKSAFETFLTETGWVKSDILYVCKHLPKWMKDGKVSDIPLTLWPMSPRVKKEPLGTVLIIGAYNYPVQLTIGPLIGAIAAGNTAILKPSEQAPNVAMVLGKIMSVLEPSCYSCVQGGIPESTTLLDQKWDKIFYTGGANVGRIIAKKAAETLTPITLELGGRNPAIVTKNSDIRLTARRLLWGKAINAGQSCISQNYTLVDRTVLPQLVTELSTCLAQFFPDGQASTPDYGRIATTRGWQRLKSLLDSTSGKILLGGKMDEKSRFMELTVVEVSSPTDPLIAEEHFGPILPLLPVPDLDAAIRIANEVDPTPLAAYPFGNKSEVETILARVRSGGATVNDTLYHAGQPVLPFGGVGESGQGAYRGKASFECFSHQRTITTTPAWLEMLLGGRYPPYTGKKLEQMKGMLNTKPNFDREGRVKVSILSYILNGKVVGVGAVLMGESFLLRFSDDAVL
ncbi:hypothetical protein MMC10_001353 [Thelotrema lepadinum]|nr:hypothetical protein [Thelotrema lepadinum]